MTRAAGARAGLTTGVFLVAAAAADAQPPSLPDGSWAALLRAPGGRIVVVGEWRTPEQQAASIGLFSAVRWVTRQASVDVRLEGEPAAAPTSPVPSNEARPERVVRLVTDPQAAPIRQDGETLLVRGDREGLRLLTAAGGAAPSTCAPNRVCLSDLGLTDRSVSGTGSLRTSFAFIPASLGGWPSGLELTLRATFDRVPVAVGMRALLRVWLNGALLDTVDIRERTTLEQTIALPAPVVEPSNVIEVEFFHTTVSRGCEGAACGFTGQLLASSSVGWRGLTALPPRIGAVVAADPTLTEVYFAEATPELARALALVTGTLSAVSRRPVIPALADASAFAQSRAGLRLVAAAAPDRIRGLEAALSLAEPVSIRNRQTRRVLLRATPADSLASLELVSGAPPTLVLQASRGAAAAVVDGFARQVSDSARLLDLLGSVELGNASDAVTLQFGPGGLEATPDRPTLWDRYVLAYRPLWYALVSALVVLLLVITYKRLGRRPPVAPAPAL